MDYQPFFCTSEYRSYEADGFRKYAEKANRKAIGFILIIITILVIILVAFQDLNLAAQGSLNWYY